MELHFKTVLCPVDFSETSRQALRLAHALARLSDGRLIVLFVGAPALMVTDGVMAAPALGSEEPDPDSLKGQLREFVKPVIGEAVELRVDYGNAAEEILEHADQCHADLIVMGTHGRTGLGRLLMGSVAEHVLRRAKCPVLLVKGSGTPATSPA
ncbi:MAG: universal stress protein [Gemmatales bacterium]|nr:universal stress protein [Gemmatales bacterium]MDW8385830.1 universal stress protein [Gemmatales bacterium]